MTFTKLPLALAASSMLLASGCMGGLRSPDNPNRNAQQAALAGAAIGGLAGLAIDDGSRARGAAIGAAIGAGAGGLIGHQLDKQEAELRAQMGNNIGIVNTGDKLVVTMPQDILFATDSATLSGGLQADLSTLAASMNRYPNTRITVVGHTDNVGDAGYNQTLSQRRAQAVTSVLTANGVAPSRVTAVGRGEDAPKANNLTPEGRAQNRRVEVIITPSA